MALLLTAVAIGCGVGLGIRWGGSPSNIGRWHPQLWQALAAAFALMLLTEVIGVSGTLGVLLVLVQMSLVLGFAVTNIRVGGMVLVATGVSLNFLVTLLNWGRPVSTSALVRSGIVTQAQVDHVALIGGRTVGDGAVLGFLGDVVPLPWGQVISIGDIVILTGVALVTSSVLRAHVAGGARHRGPGGYSDALAALGRGPAPRRGPGLHPSRMDGNRTPRRPSKRYQVSKGNRRSGTYPR